ncbi:MAG: hypothetical protein JST01_06985 [Cyanobacteria bacterium SZAS TMP-1]|nr:hypothetical protein [Cyanobacteria bacterium SZAS TMP-1]
MKNRKSFSLANSPIGTAIISLLVTASIASIPAQATAPRLTSPPAKNSQKCLLASNLSENIPLTPLTKRIKKRPTEVQLFQLDNTPLGDRTPFLMVHGLRGEYCPGFRWQKLAEHFTKNEDFKARYKIYMVRYSSLDRIAFNLQSYKDVFNRLYNMGKQKPITVMALSMGGNLAYEAMTDKDIDNKTQRLITLGTPFHGSPLFAKEWLTYSLYKRFSWPWTRVEHNLTYNFYFNDNKQLRQDLSWDNVDGAIPDVGKFRSHLPLGPRGVLTVGDTINERLIKVNEAPIDKRKLITYSGYMTNEYLASREKRILESAFLYPYFVLFTSFPAHFGREHAALGLINHDMCCVPSTKEVVKKAGEPYIYVLNDGIAPVTSAIFLPKEVAREYYLARESDIEKLKDKIDVGQARVFRDVDHLTFIGSEPKTKAVSALHSPLKDQLNPNEPSREMFDWILSDVLHNDEVTGRLAKGSDTSPAPTAAQTPATLEATK